MTIYRDYFSDFLFSKYSYKGFPLNEFLNRIRFCKDFETLFVGVDIYSYDTKKKIIELNKPFASHYIDNEELKKYKVMSFEANAIQKVLNIEVKE